MHHPPAGCLLCLLAAAFLFHGATDAQAADKGRVLRHMVLYQFKDNVSQAQVGEVVAAFLAERERSLAWLRTLAAPDLDAEYRTPRGIMRAGDMLASWVAHDNLHMRQIIELRRNRLVHLAGPYDVMYAGDW